MLNNCWYYEMETIMRSPADMQTIQIDITNACNKRCSNCTRFCGNHEKVFFMDFDTFKRAVDSLEDYDGVMGIMGGEPTLHPEFERFVSYIQEKFGPRKKENRLVYPQKDFIKEIRRREFESHVLRKNDGKMDNFKMYGPGLWSNMGATYYEKYELIQDTFGVQFLNDHINPSYHQPGLFARKDLGIEDEEWYKLRDNCWIQNEWSATITPKGAFFCEIAGALDMLFNGPGGWPIEAGWWKRKPEEFGDQLKWCEICGFALDTFMRDAEEETDDVSPTVYEMLKEINGMKLRQGRINKVIIEDGKISEESKASGKHFSRSQPYIGTYEDRFNSANKALFVQKYDTVRISRDENFGNNLNKAIMSSDNWILLCFSDKSDKEEIDKLISGNIINPGTLHLGKECAFLSKKALSLREIGFDRIARMNTFDDLTIIWQTGKVIDLENYEKDISLKHNLVEEGKRFALWGTGLAGGNLIDVIEKSGAVISIVVDKDEAKEGTDFYGHTICRPEILMEATDDYDYLLIGHYSRFEEIKKQAIDLGIRESKIVLPYEV